MRMYIKTAHITTQSHTQERAPLILDYGPATSLRMIENFAVLLLDGSHIATAGARAGAVGVSTLTGFI